ncbi:MAG TPA: large conductance mechanosensitive channel protein MscL [Bryobacteraceae bacterium]|nr:large conductance mechanosensitive channel protein MscL [Bryobacteraceae bacterium]
MIKGFRDFLLKNNVLALAVAVIVGGAVGKVVSSLAADIIMPVVSILLPSGEWRNFEWPIGKSAIKIGNFSGNVVDFLIISFVVYMITKALLKEKPAEPPPPSKVCPRCKETVALEASRCKFCTADI